MTDLFDSVINGVNFHSYEETADQGFRKGMIVELFFIYAIFLFQAVRHPLEKGITNVLKFIKPL